MEAFGMFITPKRKERQYQMEIYGRFYFAPTAKSRINNKGVLK